MGRGETSNEVLAFNPVLDPALDARRTWLEEALVHASRIPNPPCACLSMPGQVNPDGTCRHDEDWHKLQLELANASNYESHFAWLESCVSIALRIPNPPCDCLGTPGQVNPNGTCRHDEDWHKLQDHLKEEPHL